MERINIWRPLKVLRAALEGAAAEAGHRLEEQLEQDGGLRVEGAHGRGGRAVGDLYLSSVRDHCGGVAGGR